MADKDFLADVAKRKMPIQVTPGEEVQKVIASLIEAPGDVIRLYKTSVEEARAQMTEKKP